jgi:hypothetical protein
MIKMIKEIIFGLSRQGYCVDLCRVDKDMQIRNIFFALTFHSLRRFDA